MTPLQLSAFLVCFAWLSVETGCAEEASPPVDQPYIVVLGIAQDAGYPHPGCRHTCCQPAWNTPDRAAWVACLGLVDPTTSERWMFEATPDFPRQLETLNQLAPVASQPGLNGILLTHAHIGHYTGLMYLGRESLSARDVPVYAMPRMRKFLRDNGPWSQLLQLGNIELRPLDHEREIKLNQRIHVRPLLVPHRDEFSETVGFLIRGPHRTALFLPDIDKWERWETRIEQVLAQVDYAFIDGTFFDEHELPHRDMSEIPHPFVVESLQRFATLPADEKDKIWFVHLNHSNPVLQTNSPAARQIEEAGLHVSRRRMVFAL